MTLLDTIRRLDELDPQQAIYASQPWLLSSTAVVMHEPRGVAERETCVYFLDVVVARALVIGLRAVRSRELSTEECCFELISYATEHAEQSG